MKIQINTDDSVDGHERMAAHVRGVVKSALIRVGDQLTRVEVHLSDENGQKGGLDDKRCMMEARLKGRQPIAVTHQAASMELAVDGAAVKMARLIGHTLGRMRDRNDRRIDPPAPGTMPEETS
jgi:ribosome-associated translation inhibitor RaiA